MTMLPGYVRHFIACNACNFEHFHPFHIGGVHYGYMRHDIADFLMSGHSSLCRQGDAISLSPDLTTFSDRSDALMSLTHLLCQKFGKPLRNEMYALTRQWDEKPVARIDRVAVPWFGVRAWGIHVNGFVRKEEGLSLWVGKRAANRPAEPGKLDNMIGGGQPFGLSLDENLCKEAYEEAGITSDRARTAQPVGIIHYCLERAEGMRRDSLFLFDLELPEDFVPCNTDGEVAAFELLPIEQVAALVRDGDTFKFNCTLVVIDFLLRHNVITPQNKEYAELKSWLKKPLQ